MKPGPPPTPTEVLKRRGSWRGSSRPNEPKPEKGAPPCPQWLEAEPRKLWKTLVPQLMAVGVLAKIDREALARYCTIWHRWRKCEAVLRKEGHTWEERARGVDGKPGRLIRIHTRPEARIVNQLASHLLRLENEFGLTPAARARIEVDQREVTRTKVIDGGSLLRTGG